MVISVRAGWNAIWRRCGTPARPVILLNKMDLCTKVNTRISEIEAAAGGVPAHEVSATSGEGIGAVESQLREGAAAVLLGSSGVGKSSLVNRLLGREAQTVQEVRDHDCRGRHTTTARQLFFLSSGAMIIDTPELQLWDSREGLQHTFGEIAELGELATQKYYQQRGRSEGK
jgi:ribosome biogenesis GTPase / thiamine phosphate phosphatase